MTDKQCSEFVGNEACKAEARWVAASVLGARKLCDDHVEPFRIVKYLTIRAIESERAA